jgi:hypothetical protein
MGVDENAAIGKGEGGCIGMDGTSKMVGTVREGDAPTGS